MKRPGLKGFLKNQYAFTCFRMGGLRGKSHRPWPVLLHYHRVEDIETFEAQMRYLTEHCQPVPLEQAVSYVQGEAEIARGAVVLTFDDGYRSFFSDVYPVLQRYRVPATVFLVSGLVGTEQGIWPDLVEWVIYDAPRNLADILPAPLRRCVVDGDVVATRRETLRFLRGLRAEMRERYVAEMLERAGRRDKPVPKRYRILTWEQVREMDASGLITFGGHTRTHPILSRVGMSRARSEIMGDKGCIEGELGHPIYHFAYPNGKAGDFTSETIRILAKAGYHSAVTTIPGRCRVGYDPYLLPRWGINREDTLFTFATKAWGLWPPWH